MHPVKSQRSASAYRFRRAAPLTLSTVRRGSAGGSRRERRTRQNLVAKNRSDYSAISSGVLVIGELANFVV